MTTIGSLINIKHTLQSELFNSTNEKILSLCTVTKNRKASYLCLTTNSTSTTTATAAAGDSKLVGGSHHHHSILVYQIKHGDGEYKKKRHWSLNEIKLVDAKHSDARVTTHEFEIQADKLYKWYAINLHERQNFLTMLHKQIYKHLKHENKAEFKNFPIAWTQEKSSPEKNLITDSSFNDENLHKESDEEIEDFHILTEKEANELNKLVEESEFAIKDAELFIEQLGKKLTDLDGANIQSVLASEQKVLNLMEEIEKAVKEAESFEERLDCYDEILGHVRETMEKIGGKNAMIETANNNNIKLMSELNQVITQLDLPNSYQICLSEPDLKTTAGLNSAIEAGKCLQNAINGNIDSSLLRLTAVQDQMKRFDKLKSKFSIAISRYLNNLFIHLGNDMGDPTQQHHHSDELSLLNHSSVHKELAVYTDLMHWMKAMDKKAYDGLTRVYTSSLSKIYERDLRNFFSQARQMISSKIRGSREDLDNSMSKSKLPSSKQVLVPYGTLGVTKEFWIIGVEKSERQRFDSILEKVLTELEPVALQEQVFCINFFQLDSRASDNAVSEADLNDSKLAEKRNVNEEVRNMMIGLFGVLESELLAFIQGLEKLDSFYSLYVLVRLTQHVMSAQDTQSFLSMTFASALVHVKRSLDRFMNQQLQSVQDCKISKKSKCGILPYVENFEEFAKTAEEIFKKSDRRTDMDKWHLNIVNCIFENVLKHEHHKTPSQVVRMENYHHMFAVLAQLKIPVLETLKKDAKLRYNDALKSYVTKYFGRPLEKLNQFFEGVQQKVAQGVKETEISYQMAFSKQELRKVINQYPAKEVKKGLENLYKKVEKHLCEEENLLQVVWHAMQEEFIAQYNFLEERIQKCYAGAMITLEFTIHDILTFFSEIARSH